MTTPTADDWQLPETESTEATPLSSALEAVSEAVNNARTVSEKTETTAGTDITLAPTDAVAMKRLLAAQHGEITQARKAADVAKAQAKEAIETVRANAAAMVRAAQAEMEAMMRELEPVLAQAARLEDGIAAMNLYLGRDEWVHTIRSGKPAPASEPITIRQTVLAMDEESALLAGGNGIDFSSIDLFDEWLLADPRHLEQVLPEMRGVVAIMPRRTDIEYGNPWEDAAKNAANHETWWLIRNNENIYRIVIDEFSVGSRLIPTADEFTSLFLYREYDGTQTPLRPGTDRWASAEKTADLKTRHYMKIALVLQGLLDRTAFFHPLPADKVSVIDHGSYELGHVRIITDDEFAIDSGHPSFENWLRNINSQIRTGARILGVYTGSYSARDGSGTFESSTKGWKSHRPEKHSIQIVDEVSADETASFLFQVPTERYNYEEHKYVRDGGFEDKRTRYRFAIDDGNFIAIDFARPSDIRYYLQSRTERRSYLKMFPVLTAALAALEAEAETERPFRNLLSAALSKQEGISGDAADELTEELVSHWKLANKWSRPLNGDLESEAKAARMILAEAARRRRSSASGADDEIVATAKDLFENVLVVARRTNDYVVVERIVREWSREADADNRWNHTAVRGDIYVNVHIFSRSGAVKETRTWQALTSTQAGKWAVLYQDERWATWVLNAKKELHLTDDEIRAHVLVPAFDHAKKSGWKILAISLNASGESSYTLAGGSIHYLVDGEFPKPPTPGLELSEPGDQNFKTHRASITLNPKTRSATIREDSYANTTWRMDTPWGRLRPNKGTNRLEGPWHGHSEQRQLVYLDEDAVAEVRTQHSQWEAAREPMIALRATVDSLVRGISAAWEARDLENQRQRFMEDYGDASLWEDHQKSLNIGSPYNHNGRKARVAYVEALGWPVFTQAVSRRIEAREDLHGRSVDEVFGAETAAFESTIGELRFPDAPALKEEA